MRSPAFATLTRLWGFILASVLVIVLLPRPAAAQLLLTDRAIPDHRALVSFGWESTWNVRVGYAALLSSASPVTADVTWTVPIATGNPFRGGHVDVGLNPLVTAGRGLGAAASIRSGVAWSTDALGGRVSWTGAALLAPGWYDDNWNIAAEVGWRAAIVTVMSHSSAVRDLYGDLGFDDKSTGPRSVFGLTAQRVSLGLRGGYVRHRGVGLLARGGLDLAPQAQGILGVPPIFPLPFYADIAGDYRW